MRIRQILAMVAAASVATSGAVIAATPAMAAPARAEAPAISAVPSAAPQATDIPIVGRSGTLTARPAGQPSTGTAARQIKKATVTTSVRKDRVQATVVLEAAPASADNARLRITVGEVVGDACEGEVEYSTPIYGSPGKGWSKSGTTYTLSRTGESIYDIYDCAFAALTETGGYTTTYDMLGGSLAPIYAQAKLVVKSAKLLGKKKLNLVKGVWTPIEVTVRNTGEIEAGRVTVTGKGKGLKVKKAKTVSALYDGGSDTVTVMVKLKKKNAKLKLTAKASGAAKAVKKVKVQSRKAPARIQDGKYASKDKLITFTVKKGKLTGFRIYAMTTCGGYPGQIQYTWNHYSIPKSAIPKSGVVHAVEKGDNYSAKLVGLASGSTLTKAHFSYGGPNRCRVSETFTASRVG